LNDISQRVIYKNAASKMVYVSSGVPQGCLLGPLLFTMVLNDLPSIVTHSRILMYADGVRLCYSYNNIESGFCMHSDINRSRNLLSFNYPKCNVM